MVDPPDLFLAPQFQTPIADRPSLRPNVALGMRPDIVTALLALFLAIRLHLLQPGLKGGRIPGFEVRRREFRIAAPAIVVRRLRQAAYGTFRVGEFLRPSSCSQRTGAMKRQSAYHPAMTPRIHRLARAELPLCLQASGEYHVGLHAER